jgi:hypothetical protein
MESREERRNRFENTLVDRYRRRFEWYLSVISMFSLGR